MESVNEVVSERWTEDWTCFMPWTFPLCMILVLLAKISMV